MRPFSLSLRLSSTSACALGLSSLLLASLPALAAQKHHAHSAQAHAEAAHLARLGLQQKAAWRAHLAKRRELPPAQRLAMKRHDRRLKNLQTQQHQSKLAQIQTHHARLVKQQAHLARLAKIQGRFARKAKPSHAQMAHAARAAHHAAVAQHLARLAALQSAHRSHLHAQQAVHQARLSAHDVRLARQQAAGLARLRAHQQAIAKHALAHQAHLAKAQSAHAARLAAQRAHWVALHGDGSSGRSIHFWQTIAAGVPVKVITVDLNDRDVKVSAVMSRRGSGTAEPFRQMIERANPNVAVTGTFFSLDNLQPVGDIVIDGSLVHFGGMGTALCITPSNQANMVTCEWGRHHDWAGYDFVCACGPRLLRRGRVVLDPRAERFHDRHMLAPNSRIAVGITPGNKIVFAMTHTPIYLGRLAKVMRAIGASEAMNLDAGTSTGFYYNGATLARPGRQLTNMIVVYGRRQRYEHALDQLVPASYRHSDARSGARRQVSSSVVHP